jgi:hypothetical protein
MRRLLVVTLCTVASVSFAQEFAHEGVKANEAFIDGCRLSGTDKTSYDRGFCEATVLSIIGLEEYVPIKSCAPMDTTVAQAARVYAIWLEKHAERWNEPILNLAMHAFAEAWPCK